mgnify:CR=1 FL=1
MEIRLCQFRFRYGSEGGQQEKGEEVLLCLINYDKLNSDYPATVIWHKDMAKISEKRSVLMVMNIIQALFNVVFRSKDVAGQPKLDFSC